MGPIKNSTFDDIFFYRNTLKLAFKRQKLLYLIKLKFLFLPQQWMQQQSQNGNILQIWWNKVIIKILILKSNI